MGGVDVLGAIVDAPRSWSNIDELVDMLALTREHVQEELRGEIEAGHVETWSRDDGLIYYTLTPLAALRLRVELVDDGFGRRQRWARHDRRRRPRAATLGPLEDPAADLVDDSPGPAELAELADEIRAARWKPGRRPSVDRLPKPTRVLDFTPGPWHERPARVARPGRRRRRQPLEDPTQCSLCNGAPLDATTYCLCCGRWGLDAAASRIRRAEAAAAAAAKAVAATG